MKIIKKYLINLDSYQLDTYGLALKEFIKQIDKNSVSNIAFHCASEEDKHKIKKYFNNIKVFCVEDYIRENYPIKKNYDPKQIIEKLNISFGRLNYSLSMYKKFYYQTNLSPDKQYDLDLKRMFLFYNFYDEIFEKFKPNIVIHEHTGGLGSSILWEKCKEFNCKYFFIKGMYFDDRFALVDQENFTSPFFEKSKHLLFDEHQYSKFKIEIANLKNKFAPYESKKKIKKIKKIFLLNIFRPLKNLIKSILKYNRNSKEINYLLTRHPPIMDGVFYKSLSYIKNLIIRKIYIDNEVNLDDDFVIFFLQVEPELSSYSMVKKDIDTESLIKNISLSLPVGVKLYVKEHPAQMKQSRSKDLSFFKNIKSFSNVRILPINFDSISLIKKSKFVVSGSGTCLFECILHNKKCIHYGSHFYTEHQNLIKIDNYENLSNILDKLILQNESHENIEENYKFAFRVYKSMLLGKHFVSLDEKEENLNNWSNSFSKIFLYCEKL